MTREMIVTDLLSPLAPLLAWVLVALASLPALEAIRAGLAPRLPRVRRISRIFQPQTGLGLATRAGLNCAASSTSRNPPSAAPRRQRPSAPRPSPSAG